MGAITVYPEPYHYWQWACKYYPVLLNPLHDAMLTHLPEAPTFTSGFARAWAGVAESGKALIYKADSGLVRWARWPKGPRSHWPAEMMSCGPWRGVEWQAESCEAKLRGFHKLTFFLLYLALLEEALMRISLISWGLTGTQTTLHLIPPSQPLGQQEAPNSTAEHQRWTLLHVCVWAQTGICQRVSWSR